MGQSQNGAVDWIEVEEDGEAILTRYDDQQNVERILMENNSKRFRLTETTPPVQEPLVVCQRHGAEMSIKTTR
jgi:hypothetical protein